MKLNSSAVSHFTLSAYMDTGPWRYFFFLIVLCLYVLIVLSNVLLVVVICVNRSLHEPMYLFLCSLFVNELYGSTGLFPFLLLHILSDSHTVAAPLCFLQIFCVYTYGSVQFTNLAVMSYDRYVAVCRPLQYNSHLTLHNVALLIAVVWFPPFVAVFVTTALTSSLRLCGNVINKVYCDNHSVVKLSCHEATVNNVYELLAASPTVCLPVTVIFFSYIKILKVCFSGSNQTRQKAVGTCSPHLASLLNFSFGVCFEVLQSRGAALQALRNMLAAELLVVPPLINPIIYGINLHQIRTRILQNLGLRAEVLTPHT
uniref:G-protein coupled receptors family 1 profile domain-containing protein n=1 Tax=Scophthalmus maximus TaxID=52904 RepID=A0A8D2ZX29_SCOMX